MKSIFFILAISTVAFCAHSQEATKVISKVNEVTVYPSGALVSRSANASLNAGRQVVVFGGLASELDQATIGVSAKSGVEILSVSYQRNYLNESTKPKRIKVMEDSLKGLEFDHSFNKNMIEVYNQEKAMILANKTVGWGGNNSDFLIEDLEDLSDFYRDRLADIMLKVMQLEKKQLLLTKSINRIKSQLGEENSKFNRSTGEVLVEVYSNSKGSSQMELSYMVRSAGWKPNYNVSVTDIDSPLKLAYNAKVYQNTGVDWDDVSVILTNANPNLNGDKPKIHPWRLYFMENLPVRPMGYSNKMESEAEEVKTMTFALDDGTPKLGASIDYPVNDAVTQFKLNDSYSIPSNWKQQSINLKDYSVEAKYEYYSAPKVDPSAFLIAQVSNFEQYDLLPGEANLFLANTYVGKVFLNPNTVSDTLELSLGRDQSIVVKREKILEYCQNKKLGGTIKEELGIQITIRNSKSTKIQMVIEDQIPVSTNKDITVDLDEAKGAKHEKTTGKLKWTRNIMAGESETMQLKYSIKYPSDKKINL